MFLVELLIIILSADTAEWSTVTKESTNLQSRQFIVVYKGNERGHSPSPKGASCQHEWFKEHQAGKDSLLLNLHHYIREECSLSTDTLFTLNIPFTSPFLVRD